MTHDEIKTMLACKDIDWLESRWSALDEAIKKIQTQITEVESAFDEPTWRDEDENPIDTMVCHQVLDVWSVLENDKDLTVCWETLRELINEVLEESGQ